ncbi:MAG TPA: hypothetical protein P5341_13720 [Hyphomonas sp.]|nr:hypothetical protein [Hyphomonas sp.]
MKIVFCFAAASLAVLVSACTTPATTAEAPAAKVTADGEPVICRSIKETGTRFAKKECKTAAAWAEYDAYTNGNAKESTDKFQRLNTGGATQAGG